MQSLGKENIDALTQAVTAAQKVIYKLRKFDVPCRQAKFIGFQEAFLAVSKKEDMAKNVLSVDILAKFKAIKVTLLKAVILAQSLQESPSVEFVAFTTSVLTSKTLDQQLKAKLLLPDSDFKKLKFASFYKTVSSPRHYTSRLSIARPFTLSLLTTSSTRS